VLAGRHLVQLRLARLGLHEDLALAALDVAKADRAVDLGNGGRVLGTAAASNNSATRGKPPVMSRVLYASREILASVVPADTSWPSLHRELRAFGK